MKEFAIKCNTWEDACDLYCHLSKAGYDFRNCVQFTNHNYKDGYNYLYFNKVKKEFYITTYSNVKEGTGIHIYEYVEKLAIELLSGKEDKQEKVFVKICSVDIKKDEITFFFSDGDLIPLTCQFSVIKDRQLPKCISHSKYDNAIEEYKKTDSFKGICKSVYEKQRELKKEYLPKIKIICALPQSENTSSYSCAYKAEFEDGVNFKFYMKNPFYYKIFSEEDSVLKAKYEIILSDFVKSVAKIFNISPMEKIEDKVDLKEFQKLRNDAELITEDALKNQQPQSHKIKCNEENKCFLDNDENLVKCKSEFIDNKNPFSGMGERILQQEKPNSISAKEIKQEADVMLRLTKLNEQYNEDVQRWQEDYEHLLHKYKKAKNKKKSLKIDLCNAKAEYDNLYQTICDLFVVYLNIHNNLASDPKEQIIRSIKVVLINFKEVQKLCDHYGHDTNQITVIEFLKNRCELAANKPEEVDLKIKSYKANLEKVCKQRDEFITANVRIEAENKKLLDNLKDCQNKIIDLQNLLQKIDHEIEILSNIATENGMSYSKPIGIGATKQKENSNKPTIKTGNRYSGRRTPDNITVHGILIKINKFDDINKATVILENAKGKHEVVYRTLKELK